MVCSADTPASGRRTCNTWWDKVPENSSLSVSFMGWTGKWHDSDIGTSYAGSQRIDIMRYKYASTFLCYIPAYAMLLLYLFRYPVSEWNSMKTLSFVLFLTMGIALECLVNPVLLKMFLRTL